MKKLLLLGAMQMHIPIIRRAKEHGIYVITCDYIPENEGHKYADESYYDSTTDLNAVESIAQKCAVDGLITFNSDPAALTAAFVAERLSLPNSGLDAVEIMSEKDKFRFFLRDNGFNFPKFGHYTTIDDLLVDIGHYNFPLMLKPVDSSGSKGVVRLNHINELESSFENALSFSRCKRIIVEEYIESNGPQLHGDGFVIDGKLEFIYLGDHHFDSTINNLVPISTTFPSVHSDQELERVEETIQRFVSKVGFKQGGINIEARISKSDGKIYLIEVGPRNGGNFTPIVIQYASGFNFMDAVLNCALKLNMSKQHPKKKGFYAYIIVHSKFDGILSNVIINSSLNDKIIERYDYLKIGDSVKSFKGANAAIGVLIVKFNSMKEMHSYIDNIDNYCKVILEE